MSQLELAALCESSQTYIAEIEVGKKFPSPSMIERIAAVLSIESYYLFQNKAEDGRTLTPLQRQELAGKLQEAATKIVNQY
ncbi:MAG: helix-turn-helix domain-containing protein [Treponema sp.]|nr:helix-turn-helix domain-containing protein [Treponema sp.]